MRASFAAVALVAATAATACDSRPGLAVVGVAPSLVFPSGVLQSVASVTVREYAAGPAACDASSGSVTGATTPDATATLTKTGCTGGALWCGSMTITTSSAARVFAAEADGATGTAVAVGCTQAVVDGPTASISIAMQRPPSSSACGGGTVQPTEQCDPPGASGDLVCDASCHSLEELVSAVDTASGAVGPGAATANGRSFPALVWPSAPYPAGRFVALWSDTTDPPSTHVGVRVLGADLDALPAGAAPALAGGSIWMTSSTSASAFPSQPDPNDQELPAAVFAADTQTYAVVFADDSAGNFDIDLRTLDASYTAGQSSPVVVNGGGGEPGVQTAPAVALGTGDVLYVVWQSASQIGPGQIVGRTYTLATGALGAQSVLSTGSSNQGATVAALPSGWVVAWESGTDIAMVTVGADGTPAGAATVVSAGHTGTQDHPSVASIGGGDTRFAIAWADHGQNGADIVVQRFDAKGTPLPGDSTTPVNDLVAGGDQITPTIAGSSAGAFYAVGWLDAASGQIRARLLDASAGFDFNNVTGADTEFQVSLASGRTRANPVVAVGGSGPYVAFAWSDSTASPPGIYARRFPTPP
jgi:hypothetical protein